MNVLPPMAWTIYCDKYSQYVGKIEKTAPLIWSQELSKELASVNERVNYIPPLNGINKLNDAWIIWPKAATCHDYAVTKRAELLIAGLPASCLLLSEVELSDKQRHLILIIRTNKDDVILDNLTYALISKQDSKYKFIRTQSSSNPNLWIDG